MAPGKWGPINALSPKYFNTSSFADLVNKPPVLWVRGAEDCVISDRSLFDHATVSTQQAPVGDDPSTEESIRPQPMVGQMREMLCRYEQNGGRFEEIVMKNVGHTPFLEKHDDFLQLITEFLSRD